LQGKDVVSKALRKINVEQMERQLLKFANPSMGVSYCNLYEDPEKIGIGVFLLRPNYRIPLHDHPGMWVSTLVLAGKAQFQSYTITKNLETQF
jgi:cysteamine dioxygenase